MNSKSARQRVESKPGSMVHVAASRSELEEPWLLSVSDRIRHKELEQLSFSASVPAPSVTPQSFGGDDCRKGVRAGKSLTDVWERFKIQRDD